MEARTVLTTDSTTGPLVNFTQLPDKHVIKLELKHEKKSVCLVNRALAVV